jgi:outer membrane protein W
MLKKSLIGASLLLVTSSAMAQNEYFMGVGAGSGSWTPEVKVSNNAVAATVSDSDTGAVISIHGGTIINDKHKLSIGYSAYNTSGTADMNSIDLGYAYYLISDKKLKPYVGIGYSMSKYTEDLDSSWNKSKVELNTKAVMLSIGIDYDITKNQFISLGYDKSISTSGSESLVYTTGGNDYDVDMEVDKMSRWLVSYNYKF